MRTLTALLLLVGAGAIGTSASARPSTPLPPSAPCSNATVLSSWPLARLANQTIVVPAQETQLASLVPAARAGYGGVILFGTSAPRRQAASPCSSRGCEAMYPAGLDCWS